MLIRPSLVLQVKLRPQDWSAEAEKEIKRSYIYLAQPIVSRLSEEEADEGNIMRLSIRLMKPYWSTSDPKACELWDGVMPQWLRNVTRNMSVAMHNYNTVRHPAGCGEIRYEWVDFDFGSNALIRVKVDAENRITSSMPAIVQQVRRLSNEGAFGDGVALIRVPSKASYEGQLEAALQARREQQALEAQQQLEADQTLEAEIEPEADGANDAAAQEAAEAEEAAASQTGQDEAPQEQALPAFDIDFATWGIEFSDGTVREFDSREA